MSLDQQQKELAERIAKNIVKRLYEEGLLDKLCYDVIKGGFAKGGFVGKRSKEFIINSDYVVSKEQAERHAKFMSNKSLGVSVNDGCNPVKLVSVKVVNPNG